MSRPAVGHTRTHDQRSAHQGNSPPPRPYRARDRREPPVRYRIRGRAPLAAYGASVYVHHHTPHDAAQPWGADPEGPDGPGDLADPEIPARLVADAARALGGQLDILVANHGLSGQDGDLDTVDAAMLDAHWAVNTRSTLLLTQALARQPRPPESTPPGRVVMMTSGQDVRGGMPDEIAYALAKGALSSVTRTLATALGPRRITVNAVNPGPVDTGYLTGDDHAAVAAMFDGGRWAEPEDPARLIAWLTTDEAMGSPLLERS